MINVPIALSKLVCPLRMEIPFLECSLMVNRTQDCAESEHYSFSVPDVNTIPTIYAISSVLLWNTAIMVWYLLKV